MSYAIHAATGAQGRPLHARLLATGKKPIALVRNTANVSDGSAVAVDYASVNSLVAAYRGAEGVFVHLPVAAEPQRVQFAQNIVAAVNEAKPARVVVLSSGAPIDLPGTRGSAVMTLVHGIRESGVSHAIVAPRLYLENLLLPFVIDAVRSDGVLRYPIRDDFSVSWSSHLDVAEVIERLLTDHKVSGVVGLGHVPGLLGKDLAAGFAEYFGRAVSFEAMTPQELGQRIEPMYGDAAGGVVALYDALWQAPNSVIAEDTSAQALLGLRPLGVEQWLKQTL
ncbi:MAG: hydroxylase [Mesorhizobium sp.]|uniref:NmrA family NAD(P)-binding protein n=1 Tax=Mesorhizobium sp. TaxID=1871066 RepID=UPI0011FDB743|nr:NAD(P)H-binding protein [Mesorhizobium sp.]TIT24299.1 MAG: hydroxylase [Mesorhizobium sp.]